jgi:hypothetical protein
MPTISPDDLDQAAAQLLATQPPVVDELAWQGIVSGYQRTAPANRAARSLLTKTVPELMAEAVASLPASAPTDPRIPGRAAAMLPDRLHSWRRIGQPDCKPSVQLATAAQILKDWGWQNRPYKLRDARGARCICGALITAMRLGHGSQATLETSGALILAELRRQGWTGLIGPWNRQPGRTAAQAINLVETAARRAAQAGQ